MSTNRKILMKFITGQTEKARQDVSLQGYKDDSPYRNNPSNTIYGSPEGTSITMEGVSTPLIGIDEFGNTQEMFPGQRYEYPGSRVVETPMAKYGGLLNKTIKCSNCGWSWKAADGGNDVSTCHKCGNKNTIMESDGEPKPGEKDFQTVMDWYNKYTTSPGYRENLIKSGYKDPQAIIDQRLANINTTKFKHDESRLGSYYRNNKIHYSPIKDQENFPGDEPDSTFAHEFGHSSIDAGKSIFDGFKAGYNRYDFEQLKNRNKDPKNSRGEHENYADLKAIQYEAEKQGLYKAGYDEFTEEILDKLKDSGLKKRLLDNFSKKDIIWLQNNIAQTDDNKYELPIAQEGGEEEISDEELQKKIEENTAFQLENIKKVHEEERIKDEINKKKQQEERERYNKEHYNEKAIEERKKLFNQVINENEDPSTLFHEEWMASPQYQKLLAESTKENNSFDLFNNIRNSNLKELKGKKTNTNEFDDRPGARAYFSPITRSITYPFDRRESISDFDDRIGSILAHEKSHFIDNLFLDGQKKIRLNTPTLRKEFKKREDDEVSAIPQKDVDLINLLKKSKTDNIKYNYDHYTEPTEVRARLNEVRKNLHNSGNKEFLNRDLNEEDLKPLYENIDMDTHLYLKELDDYFGKENTIQLLNSISQNNNSTNDQTVVAKNGGSWFGNADEMSVSNKYQNAGTVKKKKKWLGNDLTPEGWVTSATKGGNYISFTGNQRADEWINKQIDSGKFGFDPTTGGTFPLKKPVKGLSKEDQFMATKQYYDLRAPEGFTSESQQAQIEKLPKWQQDIINKENEKRRKGYVKNNMEEVVKHPLFSPGYFTPEGAIIGAMQSAVKMGPHLYNGDYKEAAIDAVGMLPFASEFTPEIRAALKNIPTSISDEARIGLRTNGLTFKGTPRKYPINSYQRTVTEDVDRLFKEFPELEKIGSKEEYIKHLETIHPETTQPGIFYRGSNQSHNPSEWVPNPSGGNNLGQGFYFTPDPFKTEKYGREMKALLDIKNPTYTSLRLNNNGLMVPSSMMAKDIVGEGSAAISIQNPNRELFTEMGSRAEGYMHKYKGPLDEQGFPAATRPYETNPDFIDYSKIDELVVPDNSQIHVLGSDADVELFKKYMSNNANKKEGGVTKYDIGGTTGTTVAEQYTKLTGKPWSTARAEGLTDGTAEQNLALIKRLKQQSQPVETPPAIEVVDSFDKNTHTKEMAQRVVQIAEERIKNERYIDVPAELVEAAKALNEPANSCIGGVCDVLKEAGVMKKIDWSNTHFSEHAKEYGFTANQGWGVKGIENLEPGDVLQHNNHLNKQGNYYPGHSQIYLGKDANGKLRFFDNFWKTERTYFEDDVKKLLDRARKKTELSATIYKVNPYDDSNPLGLTPEEKKNYDDKQEFIKNESKSKQSYIWSVSKKAKNYNDTTKRVIDAFIEYANDNDKINDLVKKTGKSKEEIHDSLLNVFGELGAENNWTTSKGKGVGSFFENVAESVVTAFGGGKKLSVGPGQIKYQFIPKDLKEKFNIKSPNDLYDLDKVLPLMAAMDLKDKQVLENWGKNNTLSKKLFGWTRPAITDNEGNIISGGFTADQLYTETDGSKLSNGVGRYSPYLRNQYSSIASGNTWEGGNDWIPFNEGTLPNFTEGRFTKSGEDEMRVKYERDSGSYPYKVEQNWRDNLNRTMYTTQPSGSPEELDEVIIETIKKNKRS